MTCTENQAQPYINTKIPSSREWLALTTLLFSVYRRDAKSCASTITSWSIMTYGKTKPLESTGIPYHGKPNCE